VPWVDSGVDGGGLLARVTVYVPSASNPCLECAWDDNDYQLLEQRYPCLGQSAEPPPTSAPSGLGALAASLQVLECEKLLEAGTGAGMPGKQIVIDASFHVLYLGHFQRSHTCRMEEHRPWRIRELQADGHELTVEGAASLVGNGRPTWLRVAGKVFVRRLTCPGCGRQRKTLRLWSTSTPAIRNCSDCGQQMVAVGFDSVERLNISALTPSQRKQKLQRLGLRRGEIFTVGHGGQETHFEISDKGTEESRR
jgi:Zn ribbon nucleic-acid-binding protein